jgi:glutamine synthetase
MTSASPPPDLETISVCVPDHYGRLAGKQIAASRLPAVLATGLDMPDFHLVTGPDNLPAAGLSVTGEHTGFPDGVLWPDPPTLRRLPWNPPAAIVLAQPRRRDGTVIAQAPRTILERQVGRLSQFGLGAWVATELEFYVFADSYPAAFEQGYRGLRPLYHRVGDNDVLVTELLGQYLRPLRLALAELGLPAESSQGEGGAGQAELNFPASAPVAAADGHVLFKYAAKAIAHQQSRAVTFMAQPDELAPGSGCHLHISLRDLNGAPCTAADGQTALSEQAGRFLSGLLAFAPELTLLHAPLPNSYRRLQPGGWAPSAASWGYDHRAAMVRVVGRGPSLRMEFRLPGADANPYLSIAAVLAAGIAGLEDDIALPPALGAAADRPAARPVPSDLTEAIHRFEGSDLARRAFGDPVRDHVAGMARHELRLARRTVTGWERQRGFETA